MAFSISLSPAYGENGERQRTVVGVAGDAVTKPLEDFNIKSRKIPAALRLAQSAPYLTDGLQECSNLLAAIQELDLVLGPDADEAAHEAGVARTALEAGGNFLSGFIPFRGVVRTLSGANKKRADMLAAIYAGVARRSYLKGFSAAMACPKAGKFSVLPATILRSEPPGVPVPFLAIVPGAGSREGLTGETSQAPVPDAANEYAALPQ